ncbi:MAG: type IV secretion system DNA-binding domain-containing protein [Patescibacteria group bacterium]|nr:type IV secretion system DNA-binding domain-containing protein [Patescibacteria group bacterium]
MAEYSWEFFIIVGLLFILAMAWFFVISKIRKGGKLNRATNLALFLITVPREEDSENKEDKKDDKEIIGIMEQFLVSFSRMRDTSWREMFCGPPHIALEIANPFDSESISFYLAVPKRFSATAEKQIYGFFPKAVVKNTPKDFNIFTPQGASAGTYLTLKRQSFLPLKTYKNLETDPLNNIANALSKLKKMRAGAALQLVIRPISPKWRRKGVLVARRMKQGESFGKANSNGFTRFFAELLKVRADSKPKEMNQFQTPKEDLRQLTPAEEELLKAIEDKTLRPAFEVNLRLMASADTKDEANEILSHLVESFEQFKTMDMNELVTKKPFSLKELVFNFSFRNFITRYKSILNTEELASIFHFPIASTQTPKLNVVKAKVAAAPPDLPTEGLLIGKNVYRETEAPIYLQKKDRYRHLYTIGQTGTGKSVFLEELIRQDIQNGEGVCVIDPHGELVESVLECVPEERIEDVILFDPSDIEKPMGLNLLEYDKPEQKTFVINEMINIFDKLYDLKQTGGPMFEQYMRNAMLLVMSHPASGSTLMEISKVLADPDFRKFKIDHCDNQVVVDFWTKEAEKAGGEAALANVVPYVTSKLTTFVTNDIMRPIISQQQSAFNFREAMDSKKIVLINLSKGKIGELNANLLGMVIVGKILMSAMSRVDIPEEQRQDFYLYIDEFQNVTTESIASILSEARKYHLSLTIAHQFIQQLDEKIRDAVFGNVGSVVSFRIGANDSEFMANQFAPVFSQQDLINVDNFKAFIKVMINGAVSKPFSIETYPSKERQTNFSQAVKDFSRNRYGKDRTIVEEELRKRMDFLTQAPGEGSSDSAAESDMPVK